MKISKQRLAALMFAGLVALMAFMPTLATSRAAHIFLAVGGGTQNYGLVGTGGGLVFLGLVTPFPPLAIAFAGLGL